MKCRMQILFCCALGLAALPAVALAHEGEALAPHNLWTAWEFDPGIVIPLAITAALFGGAPGVSLWRKAAFWAGWLSLVLALVSPLHPLGESLFSAHMAQHEILMAISAPLLVLSRPLSPVLRPLPLNWRRAVGRISNARWFCVLSRKAKDPLTATLIHGAAIWIWHVPVLFQATLTSSLVHSFQHLSFLFSALLFWWAMFYEVRRYGEAAFYVFFTAMHTALLGALLTFAPKPWYPAYAATVGAWHLTPLQDQQLGGLIMWVPAGLIYTAAGLWLIGAWLRASEAHARKFVLLGSTFAVAILFTSCGPNEAALFRQAAEQTGGDPAKGRNAIEYYGCGSCHTIYGIGNANGLVGPPLNGLAMRMYVGGVLQNTPANMARWIRNPKSVDEKAAMPNLGVTEEDARDITSYLYTLR